MYNDYIYPFDGGNATITLTNLPAGHYSVWAYGSDGNYEITVGGISYGVHHSYEYPVINPPVWMEGVQYARFVNVIVTAGQDLVLTVRPGASGTAVISGLQIEQSAPPIAPVILTQPTGRTTYVSSNVTFNVLASGDPPLGYQWRFNGDPIPGRTNASLTLTGVQFSDIGNYSVTVGNVFGTATSSNAFLTVLPLPSCTPPPAGLVSWWKFETNLVDNWDSNDGFVTSPVSNLQPQYLAGKVGRAIWLANSAFVVVPDSPSLRFSNAMTIEAWIKPSSLGSTAIQTIVSKTTYFLGVTNNIGFAGSRLIFMLRNGGPPTTAISTQSIPLDQWTFVAATYDGSALRLYTHGVQIAETAFAGGIAPNAFSSFGIGGIPVDQSSSGGSGPSIWPFSGQLDEVSVYNRALTPAEIQSIYASDFIGKCQGPPLLTSQPLSQSVPQNEDAFFSVSAVGPKPMKFQWRFNETPLPGQTNATLILERAQNANVGFYNCVISNAFGSVKTASGDLKLLPPLSCTPAPANMISWWTGDNSSLDAVDGNNGTFTGTYSLTGKVSRAFSFNGTGSRVLVPNSASLNFGSNANFSIECWIKALPPASAPVPQTANIPIIEKGTVYSGGAGYSLFLNQGRLAFRYASAPLFPTNTSFVAGGPDLRDGRFHHVAVTVNRSSTSGGVLFVDGNPVLTFNATIRKGDLSTSLPLFIGGPIASPGIESYFNGQIDEVTMYSRALSAAEIQAIAGAGSAGKCKVPPTILTAPMGQTVTVGSNATFLVVAAGTPNLRYQWLKNGANVLNATNTSLVLSNAQFSTAGPYAVRVMNGFGTNTSPNAMLVVQAANNPVSIEPMPGLLHADQKDGRMHLQFVGTPGQQYFIEASTNLVDWTVLGTASDLDGGLFEFVDNAWTNLDACYYRITTP